MSTLRIAVLLVVCMFGNVQAEGEVSVGAYLSMTGASATFGVSAQQGIQLAIDQYNAKAKVKVKLETVDTQGKQSEAAAAVTRLADHGVVAVIGEVASSVSLAGAPIAQQRGLPMITPAATHPKVTDVGDLIFRACQTDDAQAKVMARFARTLKIGRIAILSDQTQAYSTGLAAAFETAFKAQGGSIAATQTYSPGDDFESQLRAIGAAKVQWVFVPGFYTDVAAAAKRAQQLGIRVTFLGGDGWDSDELGKLAGTALDGSYYTNHFAVDDTRAAARAFVKAYTARYKQAPDTLAALGYDAANVVLGAIAKAKSTSGSDLATAIRATKLGGATGELAFHAKDQGITKPMVVLKISSGKPRFAASVTP